MTTSVLRVRGNAPAMDAAFALIRREFDVPSEFPAAVEAEAAAAEARGPRTPPGVDQTRRDARAIPFETIDPPGARDLDQALHAERAGTAFRVHYAIADVAAFVVPGGAMDTESFARGVTVYLPDGRAPMLPDRVGQGCASLLPDVERPALLWTIDLDESGATTAAHLERATVRSRAARTYQEVQADLDAGNASASLSLLPEIGALLTDREVGRGGVSLDLPDQEVVRDAGGSYSLAYAAPLPVEGWNAQVSLLAGREAATIQVRAGVGVLRTLPEPAAQDLARLRRSAAALDVAWPPGAAWPDVVRGLDREGRSAGAFLIQAMHLLRGAGYVQLDAAVARDPALAPIHAGVGAPYAHVTAPLRRLVDRYANEIVLAHCAGAAPPAWATDALARVVATMELATRRAAGVDRAVVDAAECVLLAGRVGETFDAIVIDTNKRGVLVQLTGFPVIAPVPGEHALGSRIGVVLTLVDPLTRRVELEPAASVGSRPWST